MILKGKGEEEVVGGRRDVDRLAEWVNHLGHNDEVAVVRLIVEQIREGLIVAESGECGAARGGDGNICMGIGKTNGAMVCLHSARLSSSADRVSGVVHTWLPERVLCWLPFSKADDLQSACNEFAIAPIRTQELLYLQHIGQLRTPACALSRSHSLVQE